MTVIYVVHVVEWVFAVAVLVGVFWHLGGPGGGPPAKVGPHEPSGTYGPGRPEPRAV